MAAAEVQHQRTNGSSPSALTTAQQFAVSPDKFIIIENTDHPPPPASPPLPIVFNGHSHKNEGGLTILTNSSDNDPIGGGKIVLSDDDSAGSSQHCDHLNGSNHGEIVATTPEVIVIDAATLSPPLSNNDDQHVSPHNQNKSARSPSPGARSVSSESRSGSRSRTSSTSEDEEVKRMMAAKETSDTEQPEEFEEDQVGLLDQSHDTTGTRQLSMRDDEELLLAGCDEKSEPSKQASLQELAPKDVIIIELPSPPAALLLNNQIETPRQESLLETDGSEGSNNNKWPEIPSASLEQVEIELLKPDEKTEKVGKEAAESESERSKPPPVPVRGHRRTPSMPVNSVITVEPHETFTPPIVPRRHKKTASLVQVEARLEYNPQAFIVEAELARQARSRTAEPCVDLSKAPDEPPPLLNEKSPVPPVRVKKQQSKEQVADTPSPVPVVVPIEIPPTENSLEKTEATIISSNKTEEKEVVHGEEEVVNVHPAENKLMEAVKVGGDMSPRSDAKSTSSSTGEPAVLVTQEQLVAELKDVLRRKNRYIEVVPAGGVRFQNRPGADYADEAYEVPESASSLSSSQTGSPRPPNPSRSTPDPAPRHDSPEPALVITEQPGSSTSPRRLVEIVLVGDADAAKIAFAGASPDNKTLSFNVMVDGSEVALLIRNNLSSSTASASSNNPPADDQPAQFNEAYRRADVVVGCFARNNAQSLENLRKRWLPEVRGVRPGIPVVLAAERYQPPVKEHLEESPSDGNDTSSSSSGEESAAMSPPVHVMTLAECQAAAREMGAATFIEYANNSSGTPSSSGETSEADDGEIRHVFEAAVRAYEAEKLNHQQDQNQQQNQPSQDANKQPRKRCCTIL